ncbi:MAG: GNAT family N-acetyltransferase [Pseudomonadota bacterium]
MPSQFQYHIRPADWDRDQVAIAAVRREVFIVEQCVPEHLEWEEEDGRHHWFVAETRLGVIGIARLTDHGRIGRMAVRRPFRGKGVGRALLEAALAAARAAGMTEVFLSAQVQAMGFYARQGFSAEGDEYQDAGIPHRTMRLVFKELP